MAAALDVHVSKHAGKLNGECRQGCVSLDGLLSLDGPRKLYKIRSVPGLDFFLGLPFENLGKSQRFRALICWQVPSSTCPDNVLTLVPIDRHCRTLRVSN